MCYGGAVTTDPLHCHLYGSSRARHDLNGGISLVSHLFLTALQPFWFFLEDLYELDRAQES